MCRTLLGLLALLVGPPAAAKGAALRPGVQLAVVNKGRIYTAADSATFLWGGLAETPVVAHVYDFFLSMHEAPPRWRLVNGRLQRIDSDRQQVPFPGVRNLRFSWGNHDLHDPTVFHAEPKPKVAVVPPQTRYFSSFLVYFDEQPLLSRIYWYIREHVNTKLRVSDDKFPYHHYEFFYDLLPEAKKPGKRDGYQLVVLANGRLQRAIEKRRAEEALKPLPKGEKRPPVIAPRLADAPGGPLDNAFLGVWAVDRRGQWALREQIQPVFSERFQVFAVGTTLFFVTDAGKVYAGKGPAKGKPRKLEPWWSEAGHPVVAVVQDAATGRTFLFCRASRKADKDFYIELADKPLPRPFAPADLKAVETVEPLKTMMGYASLLVRDKKIVLPKKGKE